MTVVKEYLDVIITGLIALAAGGGSSLFFIRSRRRVSDADASAAEIRAANLPAEISQTQLKELLEVQRDSLMAIITPLREDVALAREDAKIARQESSSLSARIDVLEQENDTIRTRYWKAIGHVRELLLWIARHAPHITPLPPVPPAEIATDI